MNLLEIHVDTLVAEGLRADEIPALLRAAERAVGHLLAGRSEAVHPDDPAWALATALAGAVRSALRERT